MPTLLTVRMRRSPTPLSGPVGRFRPQEFKPPRTDVPGRGDIGMGRMATGHTPKFGPGSARAALHRSAPEAGPQRVAGRNPQDPRRLVVE